MHNHRRQQRREDLEPRRGISQVHLQLQPAGRRLVHTPPDESRGGNIQGDIHLQDPLRHGGLQAVYRLLDRPRLHDHHNHGEDLLHQPGGCDRVPHGRHPLGRHLAFRPLRLVAGQQILHLLQEQSDRKAVFGPAASAGACDRGRRPRLRPHRHPPVTDPRR